MKHNWTTPSESLNTLPEWPSVCSFNSSGIRYLGYLSDISGSYRRGSCPPLSHCYCALVVGETWRIAAENLLRNWEENSTRQGMTMAISILAPDIWEILAKKWSVESCTKTMDNRWLLNSEDLFVIKLISFSGRHVVPVGKCSFISHAPIPFPCPCDMLVKRRQRSRIEIFISNFERIQQI